MLIKVMVSLRHQRIAVQLQKLHQEFLKNMQVGLNLVRKQRRKKEVYINGFCFFIREIFFSIYQRCFLSFFISTQLAQDCIPFHLRRCGGKRSRCQSSMRSTFYECMEFIGQKNCRSMLIANNETSAH